MEEKSIFIEFMGDSPTMRVMDYLLGVRGLDFSITDIADDSRIGRATLYRIWNNLIKNEILVPTRRIGKAKLFKLNTSNPKIKKLAEIFDMIMIESLREVAAKQAEKKKAIVIKA